MHLLLTCTICLHAIIAGCLCRAARVGVPLPLTCRHKTLHSHRRQAHPPWTGCQPSARTKAAATLPVRHSAAELADADNVCGAENALNYLEAVRLIYCRETVMVTLLTHRLSWPFLSPIAQRHLVQLTGSSWALPYCMLAGNL